MAKKEFYLFIQELQTLSKKFYTFPFININIEEEFHKLSYELKKLMVKYQLIDSKNKIYIPKENFELCTKHLPEHRQKYIKQIEYRKLSIDGKEIISIDIDSITHLLRENLLADTFAFQLKPPPFFYPLLIRFAMETAGKLLSKLTFEKYQNHLLCLSKATADYILKK
ncbi:hypothetical protein [Thermovibrio sp.]